MNFPTAKNGHLFTIKLSDELSPRISSQIRRGSLQIVFLTSIYERDCQREQSLEDDCQGAEWPQDYMYQLRLCAFCISYPISLIHSWSVKANTKLQIESYDSISIPYRSPQQWHQLSEQKGNLALSIVCGVSSARPGFPS